MKKLLIVLLCTILVSCKKTVLKEKKQTSKIVEELPKMKPFFWESANIYFLLTDRFNNANLKNDINFSRTDSIIVRNSFKGGDIVGITQKIEEGYFTNLGINAICFTPVLEQTHGFINEGEEKAYGYHGYWTKDWTAIDPNFGIRQDLNKLIKTAHNKGIRILLDVTLNNTGPVTEIDQVWPEEWVRTKPICDFSTYKNNIACTLTNNLPDILTESDIPVELPDALLAKWKEENRLNQELDELQSFFERTGYPRAPRFYIIKWLTDYINEFGVDGFRVKTAKHVNENVWSELKKEADYAFETWKMKHPKDVLDDTPFFMVGEVSDYKISTDRWYKLGDKNVDYYSNGFKSLVNFEFKTDATKHYNTIFKKYNYLLNDKLKVKSVVNYLSSFDDFNSFDKERKNPYRNANILLLTPGASQVYYGDETMRPLIDKEKDSIVTLDSFMNWSDLENIPEIQKIHKHWQKLGQFRANHPSVGAGKHRRLAKSPYVFSRMYVNGDFNDKVAIGLDLPKGKKSLWVKGFFGEGAKLYDTYSETEVVVKNGKVLLENNFDTALLELIK